MTVHHLRELLRMAPENEYLDVIVRVTWPGEELGEAPPHREFRVCGVIVDLEPDTGEDRVLIDCDQSW
jgi:hypothetical protein